MNTLFKMQNQKVKDMTADLDDLRAETRDVTAHINVLEAHLRSPREWKNRDAINSAES